MRKYDQNLRIVLQAFYKAEQNVELSSFWDGGWTVKIGDESNGFKSENTFATLEEVEDFLWSRIRIETKSP